MLFCFPINLLADKDDVEKAFFKAKKSKAGDGTFMLEVKHVDSEFVGPVLRNWGAVGILLQNKGKKDLYQCITIDIDAPNFMPTLLNMILSLPEASKYVTIEDFKDYKYSKGYLMSNDFYVDYEGLRENESLKFIYNLIWTGNALDVGMHNKGFGLAITKVYRDANALILFEGEFVNGRPKGELNVIYCANVRSGLLNNGYSATYKFTYDDGYICVLSDNKDLKSLGYYTNDGKKIFQGNFLSVGDYVDGFRKAVYPDSKEVYFARNGNELTKDKMALVKSSQQRHNRNSEDYSQIPDYEVTPVRISKDQDRWGTFDSGGIKENILNDYSPNRLNVMEHKKEDILAFNKPPEGIDFYSNRMRNPDGQIENICIDGIWYMCFENGEAKANGWSKYSHKITGVPYISGREVKLYTQGDVFIRPTITSHATKRTYTVTSIGTFEYFDITSIFIPKTVRRCGRISATGTICNAFANCKHLRRVIVEEGNPGINWGEYTFLGCSQLEELPINLSTGQINKGMFEGCTKLKNIKLPVGVKQIAEASFKDCKVDTLTIPNTVTLVDKYMLSGIESFKIIYLPFNVYAQLHINLSPTVFDKIMTNKEVKIRDNEKYKLYTLAGFYPIQCKILDDYHKDLLEANYSYKDVKLNDQLLDEFISVYSDTDMDVLKKGDTAIVLRQEHSLIKLLRNKYYGYVDNLYCYNDEIDRAIPFANKISNLGFNQLHTIARPILKEYKKFFDAKVDSVKKELARQEEIRRKKEEERRRKREMEERRSYESYASYSSSSSRSDDNSESSEPSDGNSIEVPRIKSVIKGSHSRFIDSDEHHVDNDSYQFDDASWNTTFIKVYHVYSKSYNRDYYYPENNKKEYHYRTAEDAARAGWVWEKKHLVRTIGMIDD